MPKAKRPGNQHNSRHENGIVAPGKRVTKQKSNGHLNGSSDASSHTSVGALPPATDRGFATAVDPRVNGIPSGNKASSNSPEEVENGSLVDRGGEWENVKAGNTTQRGWSSDHGSRHLDPKAYKSHGVSNGGILNLAFTILRSCPLGDTLAILLVLLWLPPTLLTLTNTLFAVLTFVPPTLALPSFPPTLNDVFMGSGNTPSIATIIITDLIGLILWLVMWTPIQTLSIELAQAVVATTLGGGSSTKRRGTDSTLICMLLVTINHVTRYNWLPRRLLGFDWHAILSSVPYVSHKMSTQVLDDNETTRSPAGWIRVIVGLHILIQGLVYVLRRWYQQREYTHAVSISKKKEAETVGGSPVRTSGTTAAEIGGHGHPNPSLESPSRASNTKEAREKLLSGKKKRKQSNVVRSQQPLWAAFAATKLTVLREYEQSLALKEVVESKAVDASNLGSVPFSSETDRIWISDLSPNGFRFLTTFNLHDAQVESAAGEDEDSDANLSASLRLRINDADWTSLSIRGPIKSSPGKEEWQGEVFGLSPAASYRCIFAQGKGGGSSHSFTVTTPPLLSIDIENSVTKTDSSHSNYQPSSPTSPRTTLRRSLSAFESSLNETQSRQKRNKKDNKAALAALKKDIDILNSKINKLGSEDKAQLNRQMQWNQHTKQADDAVASLADEIEALGAVPAEDVKRSEETKTVWDEAKAAQVDARQELIRAKEAAHRERSAVQSEAHSLQQKRERLVMRKSKLADQYSALDSETTQGLDEKQRKNSEQAAKDLERAQIDRRNSEQMANYYQALQESRYLVFQAYQEIQALEAAYQEQQMLHNMPTSGGRPLTPEGDLPGTNPQHLQNAASRVSTFGTPDGPSGLRSHSGSLRHTETRPRSTSGVSGSSVYADFDDQDPAPPMPSRAVKVIRDRQRQYSIGSGSGSSGSQHDPASPHTSSGAQASPVGKRSPVWNS